jgi:glycosyltransferase involved in cell wall biosynthesis
MEKISYPKISLVTVCYNHEKYIAETIESILSQNYPNLQYIVIDDGSTDKSWEIIQKYKDRLYRCEKMEGYRKYPTIALNYGFEKTDGEIMGFLNSDDILLPKSLFTIAKIFQNNQSVDWFSGMATTINLRSEIVSSSLRLKNIFDFLIGNWKIIQQESTFWRRNLWEKSGGKLAIGWAFDTELWTRFFEHAEHFHANSPIGAFRKGQQSKSINSPDAFLLPSLESLKKMKKEAGTKLNFEALIYKICKFFSPIFSFIPNKIFSILPFLNKYSYKTINYSNNEDKWIINKINPFKII